MLHELPVDILKLAKPFVDGLGLTPRESDLAATVVQLGPRSGCNLWRLASAPEAGVRRQRAARGSRRG